ncbi:hypothetical protein Tco_0690754 [Tanacetum coccineum]
MKKKLGNGLSTLFWDDVWCDGGKLKNRFPRAYALENSKQITVGQKLAHPSLYHSFRRHPRGGLELTQVEELAKVINPMVLTQSPDSWSWTLNNSGGYTVASSRNMIDSRLLPKPVSYFFVISSSLLVFLNKSRRSKKNNNTTHGLKILYQHEWSRTGLTKELSISLGVT